MRKVRRGPGIGLIVQLALLAALAATVGLGAAGWVVGVTYGVITATLLTDGLIDQGADRLTASRSSAPCSSAALLRWSRTRSPDRSR